MTYDEYHQNAMRTANPSYDTQRDKLMDGALGLCGETGEAVDLIKKHLFQGHELEREKISEELGDIMWYVALLADALGYTINDVMTTNVIKLTERYPEGFSAERSIRRIK